MWLDATQVKVYYDRNDEDDYSKYVDNYVKVYTRPTGAYNWEEVKTEYFTENDRYAWLFINHDFSEEYALAQIAEDDWRIKVHAVKKLRFPPYTEYWGDSLHFQHLNRIVYY